MAGLPPLTDAVGGDCDMRHRHRRRPLRGQVRRLLEGAGHTAQTGAKEPITQTICRRRFHFATCRASLLGRTGVAVPRFVQHHPADVRARPPTHGVGRQAGQPTPSVAPVVDRVLDDTYDSTEGGQATIAAYWTPRGLQGRSLPNVGMEKRRSCLGAGQHGIQSEIHREPGEAGPEHENV